MALYNCFCYENQQTVSSGYQPAMFELFVGDVVYYCTADQMLAKDKIKSIDRIREKGKIKHVYLLYNGLIKVEGELFLSLKRAKTHFETSKVAITIPKNLENN